MKYIENTLGSFKRAVGIAVAKRVIGGDFAFGAEMPANESVPYGYNQTNFLRADITNFPLYFPQNCLIRIAAVSLTFNASRESVGKGIFSYLDTNMVYFDDNQNHVYNTNDRHPELFICDSAGKNLVDIALPILSTEGEHECNYYLDTTNTYIAKIFGKGMVAGIPELTGLRYLVCYLGVNYEILSDAKAKKVRGGCL